MLFKKPIPQGARNIIGNKDRKKLRGLVTSCFPECTETDVDEVLFPKNQETTVLKVQGSRIQIYFSQGEPIFFDVDSSGDLFPTCFALAKIPGLVPSFLVYAPVSKFILGGADLMVPGIILPTDPSCFGHLGLIKNKRMGIRVAGNPVPFAVGRCLIGNSGISEGKGKALEVLHLFGDNLWGLGSKSVPNDGFSLKQIRPSQPPFEENLQFYSLATNAEDDLSDPDLSPRLSPCVDPQQKSSVWDDGDDSDDGWGEPKSLPTTAATDLSNAPVEPDEREAVGTDGVEGDQSDDALHEETPQGNEVLQETAPTAARKLAILPAGVVDLFLELALLETLHTDIPDSACPISISAVLSRMIQTCGPVQFCSTFRQRLCEPDVTPEIANQIDTGALAVACDVKKSSHKKLTKLFQFYAKKKLLQIKDVRGDVTLISINRQSPIYRSYVAIPEKDKKYAIKLLGVQSDTTKQTDTPASSKKAAAQCVEFDVLEFYQPDNNSIVIFETVGMAPSIGGKYFFAPQCREALTEYIKVKTPAATRPSAAILDEVLQRCVLSKDERAALKANKGGSPPELEKADVNIRFLCNMQMYHAVNRVGVDPRIADLKVRRGKLKPIVVQLEKRQGRKVVTTIRNIQPFEIDEKLLAETLQRSLSASASTYEMPEAAKGKVKPLGLMVQGSFLNQVCDILTNQFGVPKRFICAN